MTETELALAIVGGIVASGAWLFTGWLGARIYMAANFKEYPIVYCSLPQNGIVLDQHRYDDTMRKGRAVEWFYGPAALIASWSVYGTKHGINVPSSEEVVELARQSWAKFAAECGWKETKQT